MLKSWAFFHQGGSDLNVDAQNLYVLRSFSQGTIFMDVKDLSGQKNAFGIHCLGSLGCGNVAWLFQSCVGRGDDHPRFFCDAVGLALATKIRNGLVNPLTK
jgi:hypothetical protein